jgi:predicted metal-dependent phosphoesterase TrpH
MAPLFANSLALTDHDTLSGLAEAQQAAEQYELNFIPGIELSCLWNKKTFHVLGLNVDANNAELLVYPAPDNDQRLIAWC